MRQYVGARYVPKFATPTEWQPNKFYDPLTIVTYNNSSYTSKIPVPPTIAAPPLSPLYWALTGNYNSQVQQYRELTEKVKTDLTTETNNRIQEDTKINNTYSPLLTKQTKMLTFGDSWLSDANGNYNPPGKNWAQLVAHALGLIPINYAIGGQGFFRYTAATTIAGQVRKAISEISEEDRQEYKYAFVMGGVNDKTIGGADEAESVYQTLLLLYNNFPNTQIIYIPGNVFAEDIDATHLNNIYGLISGGQKLPVTMIYGFWNFLNGFGETFYRDDGGGITWAHPNEEGMLLIANFILGTMFGTKPRYYANYIPTNNNITIHNNMTYTDTQTIYLNFDIAVPANKILPVGGYATIGTFKFKGSNYTTSRFEAYSPEILLATNVGSSEQYFNIRLDKNCNLQFVSSTEQFTTPRTRNIMLQINRGL